MFHFPHHLLITFCLYSEQGRSCRPCPELYSAQWNQHKALFITLHAGCNRIVKTLKKVVWNSGVYSPWKCVPLLLHFDIRPLIKGQTRRKISTLLNQLPLLRMQTFRDIATYWATPQEFNPQPVVVMRTILHALCNVIGLYQGRLCPRRHGALTAGAAEVGGVAAQSPGPWHEPPPPASTHLLSQEGNTGGKMKACWATGNGALQEWEACPEVYFSLPLNNKPLCTHMPARFFPLLFCLFAGLQGIATLLTIYSHLFLQSATLTHK